LGAAAREWRREEKSDSDSIIAAIKMDHHAMIQVHHEEISPPQHPQLPDYPSKSTVTGWQPSAVGKAAMHGVSDVLASRYPYPSDTMYDALEPSIAYGRNGVPKTMMVLRQLVDLTSSGEAVDEEDLTRQKRANVAKLIEALCDHTVIGDALTADKLEGGTVLLKELLADSDVQVRTGAAAALGRLATLTQGRKAICESGCAEALAHLLEDAEGADVRLEAGRTLGALARSQDGVALVAGEGTDGRVVQRMVRALVAVCARKSALETPGLAPVLLDALGQLLRGDAAAELALGEQVVPLVVELLRRRRHNAETLQALVALAGHMPGKKALIEAGALQVPRPPALSLRRDEADSGRECKSSEHRTRGRRRRPPPLARRVAPSANRCRGRRRSAACWRATCLRSGSSQRARRCCSRGPRTARRSPTRSSRTSSPSCTRCVAIPVRRAPRCLQRVGAGGWACALTARLAHSGCPGATLFHSDQPAAR